MSFPQFLQKEPQMQFPLLFLQERLLLLFQWEWFRKWFPQEQFLPGHPEFHSLSAQELSLPQTEARMLPRQKFPQGYLPEPQFPQQQFPPRVQFQRQLFLRVRFLLLFLPAWYRPESPLPSLPEQSGRQFQKERFLQEPYQPGQFPQP